MEPTDEAKFTTTPGSSVEITIASKIGRYEVQHVVGTGGMGVVLAAHDPELGRRVAIKLLASEHDVARTRLLREAQAMARLSHPNVVTVYEVLKVGDRAAIVMELVAGRDLAGWLAEAERGWREIVDAFVQAARGLAAAHRAGMVHRDFKPSNALIDRDGVVRVTDFGLVCAPDAAGPVEAHHAANDRRDVRLTQTGALLGTPAYMAPEQHEGRPVDARTDQWAFACALYGALYRQRAFVGETSAELAIAVKIEKPRPEPATTKVPRAIRASIRRALSYDPAERFGSMDDLIVALTPPRRAWVAAGVVGGLAATAAVGAALLTGGHHVVTCDGLDAPFDATWNADRARALSGQFAATGIGHAADAAEHFGAAIDRYRDDWTAMRTRACTDGRRGAISADLLDRRMHCLDVRLAEVATVVDAAVAADAAMINVVNGALARVAGVATCTDPIDTVPRPTDATALEAIARAETDVARAATLSNLGRFDQARALAESAIKVSDQTGWTPLAAKALYEIGQAQSRVRDSDAALVTFDRAAKAAARAGDDTLFAKALVQRFNVLATDLKRVDEAFAGRPFIELAVLRASNAPVVRAMWLSMLASGLDEQGKHQEALDTQIESTALWKQVVEPDSIALSDCLNNEAGYRMQLGQLDEAQAIFENLLVTDAAKFGPGNPELARRHYNLANIALKRGDNDKAIEHFEQTYAIRKAAGVVDWMSAYALGENLANLGRSAAAAPLFIEALEILERTQPSSEFAVAIRYAIGIVMTELGQLDQARAWLDKALTTARATKSSGADEVLASFALLEVAAGDLPAARRYIAESRAESKAQAVSESSSADLAESEIAMLEHDCARAKQVFDRLTKGGEAEVATSILTEIIIGRAGCALSSGTAPAKQAARDALEKRLAWLDARKPELGATAPLRFMLARALVATGGARDRVRTLAETARDGFATLGSPGKNRAAEVTRWLAAF